MAKQRSPAELLSAAKPRRRRIEETRNLPFVCAMAELRHALGLSQRDVAKEVGITCAAISTIENGTDPLLSTALKLAKFFGKNVSDLWTLK